MEKRRAFITGIAGQDGSYLSEYLLARGYEVYGIVRRNSIPENQDCRISKLVEKGDIVIEYGDLLDAHSLTKLLRAIKPHEVYNLASQSHVRISYDIPQFTVQVNALGVVNILEVIRTMGSGVRFYQASSSEMFGNSVDEDKYQRETTPMLPVSPYGCAKLFGYHITRAYRNSYNVFACNGILFNHSSPRRASNFVIAKVVKAAVRIKLGLQKRLVLGNLNSYRDWGHSKDYVRAMHLIVNHRVPDDFVVATGKTYSVGDLCAHVFSYLELEDWSRFVEQDGKYMRPVEVDSLCGDSSKIRERLGWRPSYGFKELVNEMIDYWMDYYS